MNNARPKIENLLDVVSKALDTGDYLDTSHANVRKGEREISRPEIVYVLRHGFHEARKDKYEEQYKAWNYAIRGKTVDRRELRVVVSFDTAGMLIITAIDLDQ